MHDLDEHRSVAFDLAELPKYVEAFGFIVGVQRRVFRDQDPVNIEAAELVDKLPDTLYAAGYQGPDLERYSSLDMSRPIRRLRESRWGSCGLFCLTVAGWR